MRLSLSLSLPAGAAIAPAGEVALAVQTRGRRVVLKHLTPAVRDALVRLGHGRLAQDEVEDAILHRDGAEGLALWSYHVQQLGQRGLLVWSAADDRGPLATLVPTSPSFVYPGRSIDSQQPYALSRFAYTRIASGQVWLESPLAHARLVLDDARTAALIHALARPRRAADLTDLSADAVAMLLELLLNSDMLDEADARASLHSWEFHDLLFHARSREGRHDLPVGGTYRFAGQVPPAPALKPLPAREFVDLCTPNLALLQCNDPPFALVQERRRSLRQYGNTPIRVEQLSEFLYRVARVKECAEVDVETPAGPVRMKFATRPYPAGGALYEMEFYAVVNGCEGLAPGLYHYDPLRHRLGRLSERTTEVSQLLNHASQATGTAVESLQVLLILAARFQRVAWKYAALAYALILKHVGVLYQSMYLAATAMDLAPCAVGCGNADLFARAAGTDYYAETSVGEFLLGSSPRINS